mmetsp:Transcript_37920/g.33941  ORF Transcript_37920/g.33941 Transcript_37920/m.33941 type:complete len:90 (+) Transcript_37920:651-920(+)
MKFTLNLMPENINHPVIGCGCGVEFGTLQGTLASPVSPVNFWRKEFDDIIFLPTFSCMCDGLSDCNSTYIEKKSLFYRVHGDYDKAMKN